MGKNENLSTKENEVILKKEPTAIAMRIFNETEDYESQVMRECESFFLRYNVYPNGIILNPRTIDRWEAVIADSACNDELYENLENMTFEQIKNTFKKNKDLICEFTCSKDGKCTLFSTPKYQLFIIENEEYQDGIYQLFNGYSPILENGKFTYPLIDMKATGIKIRELIDEKGITPTQIKNVCGLGSIQAVYKWFNGKSVPTIDNLGIISNLLNTPIDDILVFKNRKD